MTIKKITRLSMLLAISIVCSIIESFFPVLNGMIPGLKLGLANLAILVTLDLYGVKEAFFLSITRVILVALLRTGLFNVSFFFSLFGAIFSVLMMSLAYKSKLFSFVGISIVGSLSHSIGQIIAAVLFLGANMIHYLPVLLLFALPTGFFIGILSQKFLEYSVNILKEA